jgi:hypothetical protein
MAFPGMEERARTVWRLLLVACLMVRPASFFGPHTSPHIAVLTSYMIQLTHCSSSLVLVIYNYVGTCWCSGVWRCHEASDSSGRWWQYYRL